jgi:hexosaminidase
VPENSSALDGILKRKLTEVTNWPGLKAENLRNVLSTVETALLHLEKGRMSRTDASLIQEEFRLAGRMVTHACNRGLFALGDPHAATRIELKDDMDAILVQYHNLWLQRNRPGGLQDSTRQFETLISEYES